MWPFSNKKTIIQQGIFKGFTDSHSHILYGVDDGVKTKTESLAILKQYEEYGVKEVWLTPHIQEYMPNETKELQDCFDELCESYAAVPSDGDKLQLHLAAEYMLDNLFTERLANYDLLYHGNDNNRLLVETSYYNPPLHFEETLDEIMHKGIYPILAHPERYAYMDDDQYDRLHAKGIIFQLNIGSTIGIYGMTAQKKAYTLLSKGYYSLFGTDIHSQKMLSLFETKKTKSIILNS